MRRYPGRSRPDRPRPAKPAPSPRRDQPVGRKYPLGLLLALALAVITLLVYCPVLDFEFVNVDDGDYVVQNRNVQAGLTAASIRSALTAFDAANWHPLTWLSLELD